ncbi:dual oxidase maturation factor 1 isoform X2 [Cuculus canorus]|uniref:dual oxidase maturation factor 1 isoform X2 n=1 Tax=Cuculus canorus TaxID=55661 RepID=UPI0023AB3A36|nr:dual oxidase maturation factor 1 isoform X2 [Cuculus canorus]
MAARGQGLKTGRAGVLVMRAHHLVPPWGRLERFSRCSEHSGSRMTLWDGSFPFYPGVNASFRFDTTRAIIVSIFLSLLAAFIIILPGIRGRGRLFWLLRVVVALFVGAVVLTIQFTRDWETGCVTANTSYKSFSRALVNADVGLHIGLAGVNVTLVGNPVNQVNETINYNENFAWSFNADYDHSYSEGLNKGLPSPILYVAEKFTTQSPCSMHRQYRISGHYASLTLCWELSAMEDHRVRERVHLEGPPEVLCSSLPTTVGLTSKDGLLHMAYFHPLVLHAHPALWWLHAPAHGCADALLTALLLHCKEHSEVPHSVWPSSPENRLRWILLADLRDRAAVPSAGAGRHHPELCVAREAEACL